MDRAVEVLGPWKANNFHHHVGPGAHLTHYPVANHTMLNVVVFLSDPNEWADPSVMVEQGPRSDVEQALQGWHPVVLGMVRLLPDVLSKWALFDQAEYPLEKYNAGRVCVAGDAAHASSPHHGAGACLGVSISFIHISNANVVQVEDALCLTTLLGHVQANAKPQNMEKALEVVFETFDAMRRPRTQWLVNSSRRVCDLYHQDEWAEERRWAKAKTCFEEIRDRSYKIWDFDVEGMVKGAEGEFERRMKGGVGEVD
jgi:salicylate hydroxylase